MESLDLTRVHKSLYAASNKSASFIEAPPLNVLIIDGEGSPDQDPFQNAVGALYSISYTLKFTFKMRKENPLDHKVMPLEALWWSEQSDAFNLNAREDWLWSALIVQPGYVDEAAFTAAVAKAGARKPNPSLARVRLTTFSEGCAGQIMHIGPYSTEPETIARLHAAIDARGGRLAGKHHEIYLGDPRRTAPEKLKTILRQPYLL